MLKIFKVEPINFKLKSESEKNAILNSYKQFLKICNFDMQIIIQTDSINLDNHFNVIDNFKNTEPDLANMAEDYKNLIKSVTKERESISRKFYIVTTNKNTNVKEKLSANLINCGNMVEECSSIETMQVIKRFLKKSSGIRKELKWV